MVLSNKYAINKRNYAISPNFTICVPTIPKAISSSEKECTPHSFTPPYRWGERVYPHSFSSPYRWGERVYYTLYQTICTRRSVPDALY